MPSLPALTLFGARDLPALRPWQPARIRYGQEMRRPCGCWLDPVVFGHYCLVPVDAP